MEMGELEMGMQKDQVEDKNETAGDKGSSWSRNLGDPTIEAPRVTRAAASDECIDKSREDNDLGPSITCHEVPTHTFM